MAEVVQIKCGTYSTPVGDLIVSRLTNDDGPNGFITTKTNGYCGKVTWRFGENGVFKYMQVHTKEVKPPSGPPNVDSVISICEHISPTYTGEVFRKKAQDGIVVIVCPKCVEQKVQIADTAVRIMDNEIWEKVVSPCVTVTDLKD